jgi:hypothetical protein
MMTAEVVQIVRVEPPDPVEVARDRAVDDIERELGHRLDLGARIAITNALERFAGAVAAQSGRCDPWC